MFARYFPTIMLALATYLIALITPVNAQMISPDDQVVFAQRNLGGPRLGITFVPGENAFYDELRDKEMDRVLSQFGWHFEYQVIPDGGGPQFVVQFVPLVAGVEYGKVIPSATLAMGVRFPNGIEFGLGPNLLATGGKDPISTSLVIGVGKSFNYGGVSIPLNLVYAKSPEGDRVSFIMGYAISKGKRRL
ncbi:MAG: hypothetical protein GY839_03185 [candidate division Zixibacteria bacterium]|nr:hypothetical protein [candidate division Zixibacteria bacterium]